MKQEFWHERWQKKEIGFHLDRVNPKLEQYFPYVQEQLAPKSVFVPLCGKTLDIGFWLAQGINVIANELSQDAVEGLFVELDLQADKTEWVGGTCYTAQAGEQTLTVFCGDFFQLTHSIIGPVDCVYDRAALIALPEEMRIQYTETLLEITNKAPQLLITLDYDQELMSGPPFSVTEQEVHDHYLHQFDILTMTKHDVIDYEPRFGQKGLDELIECVYFLAPEQASDYI